MAKCTKVNVVTHAVEAWCDRNGVDVESLGGLDDAIREALGDMDRPVSRVCEPAVLELEPEETEFLYRLLGNHIYGGGTNRDLNRRVWGAMKEGLGVPPGVMAGALPTQGGVDTHDAVWLK